MSIPAIWQREIDAGTEFGKRVALQIGHSSIVPRLPHESKPHEPVGTILAAKITGLLGIKAGSGCNCQDLATKMDAWGIAGCELNRADIVSALVANRDILTAALKEWSSFAGLLSSIAPDALLRQGAEWLLSTAISETKARIVVHVPPTVFGQHNPMMWIQSLKAEQDRLYEQTMLQPPPPPDPFDGEPVLHFGAHLWPVKGNWKWHVDLWNQMPQIINGKCFVGIAISSETDDIETVKAALHPSFIVHQFANTGEGENHTFRWLQDVVPQGQDDVLIYCHSKGVRTHTASSEAVRRWSEAMYQTVIFNHEMIREKLAAGYKNCHSFRTFGTRPLSPTYRWHPSGTFFAVRAKYLAGREVKSRYGGVEAWCGDHFGAHESWCEFYDNSMFTTLYDHKESTEIVKPALIEWNRKQRYDK